jgi:hypothetical protein
MEYKGYTIRESQGHGKAGKGRKYRSSVQVMEKSGNGYLLLKAFPYIYQSSIERAEAVIKAKKFIDGKSIENKKSESQEQSEHAQTAQISTT